MAVGQADDDHPEMQQVGDDREQGRLVAAVLRGRRGEGGADLAVQGAARPQATRLIEEVGHLRGHPSKPGADADDDRVVVRQVVDRRHRSGLIQLVMGRLGDLRRDQFGHALDVDRGAGRAGALGDGFGHLLDVTVGGVVENEDLRHVSLL